MQKIKEIMQIM